MEAPEFYQGTYSSSQFLPEKLNAGDHFAVEDLLDFSNEDAVINDSIVFEGVAGDSTESSSLATVVESCNSSSFSPSGDLGCGRNWSDGHFSGDLCVPYDDLAELEWLSNFVEESFSNDDHLHKLQLISGMRVRPEESTEFMNGNSTTSDTIDTTDTDRIFDPDMLVPAKARSKRNRTPPCDWTSRLQVLSPATWSSSSSSTESDVIASPPLLTNPAATTERKTIKICPPRKKDNGDLSNGEGRRCLHCATDKTPQWRTGPMGPKTLCNACGVRFKSGRLVPEYRPAASPTFVLTKHSNSHRKVLELRRQKEMMRSNHHHHHHHHQQHQQFFHHQHHHQEQNQNMVFDVLNDDDYLIHQHIGPDFRQLI